MVAVRISIPTGEANVSVVPLRPDEFEISSCSILAALILENHLFSVSMIRIAAADQEITGY